MSKHKGSASEQLNYLQKSIQALTFVRNYTLMSNKIKELRKFDSEVYRNMDKASQKTIDIIQDICSEVEEAIEENSLTRYFIGAYCYDIDILIEVWNPSLEFDVQFLKKLYVFLDAWRSDIEFSNDALGVPKES